MEWSFGQQQKLGKKKGVACALLQGLTNNSLQNKNVEFNSRNNCFLIHDAKHMGYNPKWGAVKEGP